MNTDFKLKTETILKKLIIYAWAAELAARKVIAN